MALQAALGTSSCTELWVAKGTYLPIIAPGTQWSERLTSFNVRPGVALYGGFAGTETDRSQRDFTHQPTILSGDIGVPGSQKENSLWVVIMDGTTSAGPITASTVLDGFTIRDGTANYPMFGYKDGAGLRCLGSGSGNECSPSLRNLNFLQNNSHGYGGAVYLDGRDGGTSSPTFSNVTFSDNRAVNGSGGALFNDAENGGTSSPTLGNVTFSGNAAGEWGGAIFNNGEGGGTSSPKLVNVTFSGNSAVGYGSVMVNHGGFTGNLGTSAPILINVIAWNNPAGIGGGILNYFKSTSTITFSIIEGGCPVQSGCSDLVAGDPQLGALADNGGSMQTIATAAGSPAIDAGNDADCDMSPVNGQDQRGAVRPHGAHCDIGAVEYFPGNYVIVDILFEDGFESP